MYFLKKTFITSLSVIALTKCWYNLFRDVYKKFLKKFANNKYYKDFLKNNSFEINIFELADILGSAAGNGNHIRSKFYDYKSLCLISSDKNLILFMNEVEKKFPEVLNEKLLQQQHMASNKKLGNILWKKIIRLFN